MSQPVKPVVVLLGILLVASDRSANAVVCATGSGLLRLRSACRVRERVVDAAAFGIVPAPTAVLRDSNLRLVGQVLDVQPFSDLGDTEPHVATVLRTLESGALGVIQVSEHRFVNSPGSFGFSYLTADCSGSPLLRFGSEGPPFEMIATTWVRDGFLFYVQGGAGRPVEPFRSRSLYEFPVPAGAVPRDQSCAQEGGAWVTSRADSGPFCCFPVSETGSPIGSLAGVTSVNLSAQAGSEPRFTVHPSP